MKSRLILIIPVAAVLFTSCSTMYKSGQTPDDVYYSPARPSTSEEYVQVDKNGDQYRDGHNYGGNNYDDNYTAPDDWWLRMRVMDPNRWSAFDDYDWNDYRYNSWAYGYSSPIAWNMYWNSYYTWNAYYNPYCSHYIIINPKVNPGVYNNVRNFSLSSYTNTNYNLHNTKTPFRGLSYPSNQANGRSGRYSNSNSGGGVGNSLKRVFSNGNSNGSYYNGSNSGGTERSSRSYTPSYTPSNSGGSGGGSRSGGGGGGGGSTGSRPGRG